MDRSQRHTRGGNADTSGKAPKAGHEEEALLDEGLEESFPASDPPSSTQPTGKEPPAPKKRIPD